MKYSRMLFPTKNDNLIINILPLIEHSVENKKNFNLPDHSEKRYINFTPLSDV
jgi:hypothetical protein